MRHLRWIMSIMIFMVATDFARSEHGWAGFWIATVLLAAYGALSYVDGYYARQREIEQRLVWWTSTTQASQSRSQQPPRTP